MFFTAHSTTSSVLIFFLFKLLNLTFGGMELFLSLVLGALPDIDAVEEPIMHLYYWVQRKRRKTKKRYIRNPYAHHKFITHKPMFWYAVELLGFFVDYFLGQPIHPEIFLMGFISITSHFVMDGIGEAPGEGIEWLWPFMDRKFGPWVIAREKNGEPINPMKWYRYYFHNPFFLSWEMIGLIWVVVLALKGF